MTGPAGGAGGAAEAGSPVLACWLGRCHYLPAWELQERLCQRVQEGGPEVLLLCEHEPVITLGASARPGDLLADEHTLRERGIECVRTSRGGKATYHGPGQLVLYPIVRLARGVLHHVQCLGQAAVEVAGQLGVKAAFSRDPVGVFAGPRKLGAIGVKVRHRVALHGLALNVTPEATAAFRLALFVPCGQAAGQVTSLAEEGAAGAGAAGAPRAGLTARGLAGPLAQAFCRVWGRPFEALQELSDPRCFPGDPS